MSNVVDGDTLPAERSGRDRTGAGARDQRFGDRPRGHADRAGADEQAAWRVCRRGSWRGVVLDRDDQPGPRRGRDRAADVAGRQRVLLRSGDRDDDQVDVRFSITARQDKAIRAAIKAISEDAWQPIR